MVTTVISAETAEIMYRCAINRVVDGGLFDGINGVTWRIRQIDLCGGGDVVCRYYCCGNLLFLRYYYRHRRICTKSSRCKQQEAAPESPKQRPSSAMFTVVVAAHAKIWMIWWRPHSSLEPSVIFDVYRRPRRRRISIPLNSIIDGEGLCSRCT